MLLRQEDNLEIFIIFMTGTLNLAIANDISDEELRNMFMQLMLPEHETKEKIWGYARKALAKHIADKEIPLEDITAHTTYTPNELREELEGRKPFDNSRFDEWCYSSGKHAHNCFPYNFNVPDSKYTEFSERLFNRGLEPIILNLEKAEIIYGLERHFIDSR